MDQKYHLGAIPSPYDVRDYNVRMPVAAQALPSEFCADIFDEVYSQKHGTCVSQSVRTIYRQHFGKEFGVNFLYALGRSTYRGSGMYPKEAANFAVKNGIALLEDDSKEYEMTQAQTVASTNRVKLAKSAAPYKGGSWGRCATVAQIKNEVYQGKLVMACFALASYNIDNRGVLDCSNPAIGYHQMTIIGWKRIDSEEYAIVRNTWGKAWGKKGCCYISWDDVLLTQDVIVFDLPASTPGSDVRRTLRYKVPYMTGADVTEAQTKLNAHGIACAVNGTFRSVMKAAVKKFQKAKGLTADGIIGEFTWRALDIDPNAKDERDNDPSPILTQKEYPNISANHLSAINKDLASCSADRIRVVRECLKYMYDPEVGDGHTPVALYIFGANLYEKDLSLHIATEKYIKQRAIDRPQYFTNGRKEWMIKKVKENPAIACSDCSGMEVGVARIFGWVSKSFDTTANNLCGNSHSMATTKAKLMPGDWVGSEGHIATYVGGGLCAEFAGGSFAAQLTDLNTRKVWDFDGQHWDTKGKWRKFRKPRWYD